MKRGETMAISAARWASAVLHNGLGNHEKALEAAEWAWNNGDLGYADWSLPELILAAVRVGDTAQAGEALQQLAGRAHDSQSEWAMGIEARCRALLSEGTQAEQLYGEAIERLSRTRVKVELARTHLQYGEWLRRERRKLDARAQLESALMMQSNGAAALAVRILAVLGADLPRDARVNLEKALTDVLKAANYVPTSVQFSYTDSADPAYSFTNDWPDQDSLLQFEGGVTKDAVWGALAEMRNLGLLKATDVFVPSTVNTGKTKIAIESLNDLNKFLFMVFGASQVRRRNTIRDNVKGYLGKPFNDKGMAEALAKFPELKNRNLEVSVSGFRKWLTKENALTLLQKTEQSETTGGTLDPSLESTTPSSVPVTSVALSPAPQNAELLMFLNTRRPPVGSAGHLALRGWLYDRRGRVGSDGRRRGKERHAEPRGDQAVGRLAVLRNNGSGALCFIYSVVMALTNREQHEVEATVQGIAKAAGAKDGWIATDSETAKNVIAEIEKKFGLAIQVIEVQNSDTGLKISRAVP